MRSRGCITDKAETLNCGGGTSGGPIMELILIRGFTVSKAQIFFQRNNTESWLIWLNSSTTLVNFYRIYANQLRNECLNNVIVRKDVDVDEVLIELTVSSSDNAHTNFFFFSISEHI